MVYSFIIAGVSAVVTLWRVFLKELTNGNVMAQKASPWCPRGGGTKCRRGSELPVSAGVQPLSRASRASSPSQGSRRLSKNLAEDVRDRAAGGVCGGAKSPPRVQSNGILKLFLKVSKSAQRGEKTFSTRWGSISDRPAQPGRWSRLVTASSRIAHSPQSAPQRRRPGFAGGRPDRDCAGLCPREARTSAAASPPQSFARPFPR